MPEPPGLFRYVYAIIPQTECGDWEVAGISDHGVFNLSSGALTAVVSAVDTDRVRPERRHLAAHQRVLKHLLDRVTLLPFAFGTIVANEVELRRLLDMHRLAFLGQLDRLRGRAEMSLRVRWDVPNIFEFFVRHHEDLRDLRDSIFRGERTPSADEKIEIGRSFERILEDDRRKHADQVMEILESYCAEIITTPCRKEQEVMNLACLVRKSGLEAFEEGVRNAARQFDNNFAFDFSGPWAPYSFVKMEPGI